MFCSKCGNKVEDTWVKCPYCGSDLRESMQGNETMETLDDDDTQVVAEARDGDSEQRSAESSEQEETTDIQNKAAHPKKKLLICLCVLIGVLVTSAVVFVALRIGGGNSKAGVGKISEKPQEFTSALKEENDDSKEANTNNEATGEENSESPDHTSLGWKEAYLNYLKENENTDYGYSLEYIDGDDIPELVIDYKYTAGGMRLCTYDGEKVIVNAMGGSLRYRRQENLMCTSGGRMDRYYDIVCKIVDGVLTEISRGEYGIFDYDNIEYDETGCMIYEYFWNGEKVSEFEYDTFLEPFNEEIGSAVIYSSGNGYLYDIIKILEHPLDITMIDPYLNNNGYESMLNHYVILFDGIENDKLHFTVTDNDILIASASATIIDAKTAKYKNANSELVIKFCVDYKELKIEGYIDTIDLTGDYSGRWG